jgi:cell division protein FtsB
MSAATHRSASRAGAPGRGARLLAALGLSRGLAVLCAMGAAAFLLLAMAVFGDQGIVRIRQLGRDRAGLEQKIASLDRETRELRRRLDDLRGGKGSYEKAARDQLGLVKPGEVVYDFRTDPLK